jgi:hypothetical protein
LRAAQSTGMGVILDSSVIIAAERRAKTVEQLIERIVRATGDQDAALSAVGLTELFTASIARPQRKCVFAVNPSSTNYWRT